MSVTVQLFVTPLYQVICSCFAKTFARDESIAVDFCSGWLCQHDLFCLVFNCVSLTSYADIWFMLQYMLLLAFCVVGWAHSKMPMNQRPILILEKTLKQQNPVKFLESLHQSPPFSPAAPEAPSPLISSSHNSRIIEEAQKGQQKLPPVQLPSSSALFTRSG